MISVSHSKKCVLVAIESFGGGGAERVALDIVKNWPECGTRPVLLVASRYGEYVADLPKNIELIEVGVPSSPRRTFHFLSRLKDLIRGREIAGVISHMTSMNRMMLRAKLAGIVKAPMVVVEHNNFLRTYRLAEVNKIRYWCLRAEIGFLYRRADVVVGCSQGVASQIGDLFGIVPSRLKAIVNPLDPRFLNRRKMDQDYCSWFQKLAPPVFVSVGRMVEQKGFGDLIRAFAMQRGGSLVILGKGPKREELEKLAKELGVDSRVEMPGFVNAPEQILQAADLYVSSSLWEGYPLSLIEAYAAGLPVVARACNFGPEEIVISDRPGQLVRSDRIEDLASAMTEIATTTPRAAPGSIPLPENTAAHVAARYCALFQRGEQT